MSDKRSEDTSPSDSDAAATAAETAAETQTPAGEGKGRDGKDYNSGRPFDSFPVSESLLKGLGEMGYTMATPVQAQSIEPALAGRDMLVRAKTGTGKTTAFGLPICELVDEGARCTQAIILSPTRELANQIARELSEIVKYKDVRVMAIYGGVGMGPQEEALREGVEIVVGTPGRVADHIRRGNLDLSTAKITCLDEADEMLSMGFYKDVTGILKQAPKGAQCLLFSATVAPEVKRLIQRHLTDPVEVMLSTDQDRVEGITHVMYETSPGFHKVRALLAVIDTEKPGSTIIFCNTREDTATVATFLDRQGLNAQLISGELPQSKREKVMARVKAGDVQFLVATDVASRGIDISNLSHVINYSLPFEPPVYMHRVGRTGRIGKQGIAISLVGGPDLSTRLVLEKQFEIDFEERVMPTADEANKLRVDRQVDSIQSAMGTTAFEGFLGLTKALKAMDSPKGDMLIATALYAFFESKRNKRAEESGLDSMGDVKRAREDKREERDEGRGRGKGRRDRDDRGARSERPRRDDRPREDKPRREKRDDDKPRSEKPRDEKPRSEKPKRDSEDRPKQTRAPRKESSSGSSEAKSSSEAPRRRRKRRTTES
jgi:ATP-dependent RNA helicase DeaD